MVCFVGFADQLVRANEAAWINFDPSWPAHSADREYEEGGWSPIRGIEFEMDEDVRQFGSLSVLRDVDSNAALALDALLGRALLRQVMIDFRSEAYRVRAVLEGVVIVGHELLMSGPNADAILERIQLDFQSITYIYRSPDAEEQEPAVYVEHDYSSGQGRGGEYTPRRSDDPPEPVTASGVERAASGTDGLRIRWPSEPGIDYVIEFTPSLDEDFRPIAEINTRIGDDGRYAEVSFDDMMGFFRVRER